MRRAVAWYAAQGIVVQRLLTDNGCAYRSAAVAIAALDLGVSQRFTQPYRPHTNGKAERFIRTLLTQWVYAIVYGRSGSRTRALRPYLSYYNHDRRHRALNSSPPPPACRPSCKQRPHHLHLATTLTADHSDQWATRCYIIPASPKHPVKAILRTARAA